jgi:hypothetical protein
VCACVGVPGRVLTCSLAYPAWNLCAPCCDVICGFCFRHIFSTSHKREKLLKIKCVFWFSPQLLSKTFLIIRRMWRHIVINVKTSWCKLSVIRVGFEFNMKFLDRFSGTNSNIKFHQNPSSGSRVVPYGRTDMKKPIVAFRNFAKVLEICNLQLIHWVIMFLNDCEVPEKDHVFCFVLV